LALLRCNEKLPDRRPLIIRSAPIDRGARGIAMIHHPRLGPKRVSLDGGQVTGIDGHQISYVLATQPGSAGAPVMDNSWRVFATHSAARPFRSKDQAEPSLMKSGPSTHALMKTLQQKKRVLWREIVAAQTELKTVYKPAPGDDERVSFVIEMLAE